MNRKIIIPVIILAVLLPAIGVMTIVDEPQPMHKPALKIPTTDKQVTIIHSDEWHPPLNELVELTDLIIKGQVISTVPFEKQIDPGHKRPMLFTIATIQIQEVLKGEIEEKTIQVMLFGGESETRITMDERLDVKSDESYVMFLQKDPDSIFGNYYAPFGPTSSLYAIDGITAKNYFEEKNLPYDTLKLAVNMAKNQP